MVCSWRDFLQAKYASISNWNAAQLTRKRAYFFVSRFVHVLRKDSSCSIHRTNLTTSITCLFIFWTRASWQSGRETWIRPVRELGKTSLTWLTWEQPVRWTLQVWKLSVVTSNGKNWLHCFSFLLGPYLSFYERKDSQESLKTRKRNGQRKLRNEHVFDSFHAVKW